MNNWKNQLNINNEKTSFIANQQLSDLDNYHDFLGTSVLADLNNMICLF